MGCFLTSARILPLSGRAITSFSLRRQVNRTAAEMAAFVGLKDVVTVIKGFVPRSDIERFAKPQGRLAPRVTHAISAH